MGSIEGPGSTSMPCSGVGRAALGKTETPQICHAVVSLPALQPTLAPAPPHKPCYEQSIKLHQNLFLPLCRPENLKASFKGRFSAVLLSYRTQPDVRFLAISYHGRKNGMLAKRVEEEGKKFLRAVGKLAVQEGVPALVGGDFNTPLKDHSLPRDKSWEVQLG